MATVSYEYDVHPEYPDNQFYRAFTVEVTEKEMAGVVDAFDQAMKLAGVNPTEIELTPAMALVHQLTEEFRAVLPMKEEEE